MMSIDSLREELRARRGTWREICEATGISYWWMTKFANGRFAEPGVSKIEALRAYFAATASGRVA